MAHLECEALLASMVASRTDRGARGHRGADVSRLCPRALWVAIWQPKPRAYAGERVAQIKAEAAKGSGLGALHIEERTGPSLWKRSPEHQSTGGAKMMLDFVAIMQSSLLHSERLFQHQLAGHDHGWGRLFSGPS